MKLDARPLLPRTSIPVGPAAFPATRALERRGVDVSRVSPVAIGEAPFVVSAGLPGAREEVRAFANRIAAAWQDFLVTDFASAFYDGTKHTPSQLALMNAIRAHHAEFEAYRAKISTFDLAGPSPSEAWQALIVFETQLRTDRANFGAAIKPLASKAPPPLENEGGVKQEGPLDKLTKGSSLTVPIIAIAVAVTAVAAAKIIG